MTENEVPFTVKAITSQIVSVTKCKSPPIGANKVPEGKYCVKMIRLRESIKIVLRFTNRKDDVLYKLYDLL